MTAPNKFDYGNVVVYGNHKVGVVDAVYYGYEPDSEEDVHKCPVEKGQIQVSSHLNGKKKKLKEEEAVLLDHHIGMGGIVKRINNTTGKNGRVVQSKLMVDLLVLPHMNTVVTNVDASKLLHVNSLYGYHHHGVCLFGNWAGELCSFTYKYLVKSIRFGFKGWMKSGDMKGVKDIAKIREDQEEDGDCFYPKQSIAVPNNVLKSVKWVEGFKPPLRLLAKLTTHPKGSMQFLIETFTVDSMEINWHAQVAGNATMDDSPKKRIMGEDLKNIRMVSETMMGAYVDCRCIAMFDKKNVVERKNILSISGWKNKVAKLHKTIQKENQKEEKTCSKAGDTDSNHHTPSQTLNHPMLESLPQIVKETLPLETKVSPQATKTDKHKKKIGVHYHKKKKLVFAKKECFNYANAMDKLYTGEVILTRRTVNVQWEDGTVENDIPSRYLKYSDESDDDDNWSAYDPPGRFVAKIDEDETCKCEYRVLMSVDTKNRIANVSLLDMTNDKCPQIVGIECISLLDMTADSSVVQDIGSVVMKIGHRTSHKAVDNVGKIVTASPQRIGMVCVRWANGCRSYENPRHLTPVIMYDKKDRDKWHAEWEENDDWEDECDGEWHDELHWASVTTDDDDSADKPSSSGEHPVENSESSHVEIIIEEQSTNASPCDNPDPLLDASQMACDYKTGSFEVLESVPTTHNMYEEKTNDEMIVDRSLMKAIKREHNILTCSLPPHIHVTAYEDRLDLYSCMMEGVVGTPYYRGLFFFDAKLPDGYPTKPPHIHYKSYCEDLNPNLSTCGSICLSLLNSDVGKEDCEKWNDGSSLLQVFVSINGMVLNSEPCFNHGSTYEPQLEKTERGRRYNEIVVVRTLQSLTKIAIDPPKPFEDKVNQYCSSEGQRIIDYYENLFGDDPTDPGFPLLPLSQGCILAAKPHLNKLKNIIQVEEFYEL